MACKVVPAQGKGARGDSGGEAGGTGGDLVPACMYVLQATQKILSWGKVKV